MAIQKFKAGLVEIESAEISTYGRICSTVLKGIFM
jgi:hypothetical protein